VRVRKWQRRLLPQRSVEPSGDAIGLGLSDDGEARRVASELGVPKEVVCRALCDPIAASGRATNRR